MVLGETCHPNVGRGSAGIPVAAPLTPDMVSRQRIRDSLSSPAATCREEIKGGWGGMGLSWPIPGHHCCPHRLFWPVQLLASLSITQGSPVPQDGEKGLEKVANPAHTGCTPGTLLCQKTQVGAGPSCPGPRPFSLPWNLKMCSTAHGYCWHDRSPSPRPRGWNEFLPGTCYFTSCFSSSKSSGPQEAPTAGPHQR